MNAAAAAAEVNVSDDACDDTLFLFFFGVTSWYPLCKVFQKELPIASFVVENSQLFNIFRGVLIDQRRGLG